jgi:hypothetical protein
LKRLFICALFIILTPKLALAGMSSILAAATKFAPGFTWKKDSVVAGNFSCSGYAGRAILGTNQSEIVVAIFKNGLLKPPDVLRYSASKRDPTTVQLKIEDLDFETKKFESEVGYIPNGLRPSKTCKGLNLSDGKIDSAHIYWNQSEMKFSDWSL